MAEKEHCCKTMAGYIDPECSEHPRPEDCPDALVSYDAKFDSYSLLPRFGEAWTTQISFCPWCGDRKRDLRDEYFDRLGAVGIEDPFSQTVPDDFKTDKWWKDAKL